MIDYASLVRVYLTLYARRHTADGGQQQPKLRTFANTNCVSSAENEAGIAQAYRRPEGRPRVGPKAGSTGSDAVTWDASTRCSHMR